MPFIRSISNISNKVHPFPFNINGIKFAKDIALDEMVTVFVGDNGSGKSTLLETLALKIGLQTIGGQINVTQGYEAAELLKDHFEIKWSRELTSGFFFRAEDFSDFINAVENEKVKILDSMRELEGEVDQKIIDQLIEGQSYKIKYIKSVYGDDMQAYSHGEAFMKIINERIKSKGIYLLDEPEAALSPMRQLGLIAAILEMTKKRNAQFIIATHSPILMGIPNAFIYEIDEEGIKKVAFEETQHYKITKSFLDNPQAFLRHLL